MTKYRSSDIFGSTEIETSDGPAWKVEYPSVESIHARQHLESTLARTFVRMQRERVPGERQRLWAECIRLSAELEKMSDDKA